MDVLVVAGEASGDQHAADAVTALKSLRPDVKCFGMGGAKMAAAGVELIHGAHEISVMGIVEVLPKIPRIWQVMNELEAAAVARKPKVALLVDVPDFNLRLAGRLKKLGIPVVYFVAPMAWAWREGRTRTIAKLVDTLCCILPFEEKFFRERGVNATYVGNPTLDQVPDDAGMTQFRASLGLPLEVPTVAVLPGSRRSEITRLGPTLAATCQLLLKQHPGTNIVIPVASGLPREFVEAPFKAANVPVTLIDGRAPEVVGASEVAIVASGTASLEAGLMRRPLVCVYRLNVINYAIGRMLVRIPFFGLVNLLAGKRVVPELLQADMNPEKIMSELEPLWHGAAREVCLRGLDELRTILGPRGAARRVAEIVSKY
ncbi:MAG: lipid-A-disaccharide synthase [Archangium gephyra]|uniref:Lipid-A-disaccharide synthase n=1 Tax=Archangium gephyra TaxID=48 RepID=A0A2W5UHH5_9BACT|nr:MAG: lipid-A-disaccharide synthase [Archangium gephyra]